MNKPALALMALITGIFWAFRPASAAEAVAEPAAQVDRTYDLCAHGLGYDSDRPFTKKARVRLLLRGAVPSEAALNALQAQLINQALWPEQASRVYVENFNAQDCPVLDGGVVELSVDLRADAMPEFESLISRSDRSFATFVPRMVRSIAIAVSEGSKTADGNATWLRIFYATNRQLNASKSDTAPASYGSERVDKLSYGEVEVAVQSQPRMRDNESAAILRLEKVSAMDNFSISAPPVVLERDAWLAELRRKAASFEKPGVLLFVHGYNVDFANAAKRAAQLSYDLAFPGPTVFFAWPSDASTLKYLRDGRDAENSWQASAQVLSDLVEALPTGPIYVVAHSMGNRVLLGGLATLFDESTSSRKAFREVVLAAPDVDQDYYRLNWARRVQNRGPRLTLYASSHDLALGSSEFLNGGVRLGMGGTALYLDPDVDSVDASRVAREFFGLNHSYFGDSQTVLSDIFFLIRQGKDADKRPHLRRVGSLPPYRWELH
ncbi:alpha/beta fold hydrolase [Variovorax gossypii]|uniref:Alpha/beta fold hydrolase n=1 Tax=Variovorax gossypii TaxID=1679495 RepID=A0A431TDD0_9BURK|nr:alpha/beta hydrolase [Variovorax gossypii]RTQ30656.1 alpha/beta fold hydrolase [Variovorax gossypii]